jgi:NitT/TauT family transport system permease protein
MQTRDRRRLLGLLLSVAKIIGFFLALAIIWQAYVVLAKVPGYILPSPIQVYDSLTKNYDFLTTNSWPTITEALEGLALGTIVGIGLAVVIVYSKFLRSTVVPLVILFNSFPKVAIAPLLVVWFGLGLESKVVMGALLAFFPVVINMITGLGDIDPDIIDLIKVMKANEFQIFLKVRFPHSLPSLFDALKIAMPLAIVGAVIGEFVGAREGLGYEILVAQSFLDTPLLFAALIFLIAISIILYYSLVASERVLLKWKRNPAK